MTKLDDGHVRQLHAAIATLFSGGPDRFPDLASDTLGQAVRGQVMVAGWRGAEGWRALAGQPSPRAHGSHGLTQLPPEDPWAAHGGRWVWQIPHKGGVWSVWLLAFDGPAPPPELIDPVQRAVGLAGSYWLDRQDRPAVTPAPEVPSDSEDPYAALDPLTADCLRLAAQSWSNREIAAWLGISRATVTRRLRQAYDALGVDGRRALPLHRLLDRPKPPRHAPPEVSP